MLIPNQDVRLSARAAGVPLWYIAQQLGMSDNNLYRKLRETLTPEFRAKVENIISTFSNNQKHERIGG